MILFYLFKTNLTCFYHFQAQNEHSSSTSSQSTNTGAPPGGRYTPLSALASLQPGGTATAAPGPRFPPSAAASVPPQASTSFQQHHFAPHQGKQLGFEPLYSGRIS